MAEAPLKKRKPNWSKEECLLLTQLVTENKNTVEGKFGPGLTSAKRQETWEKITTALNAIGLSQRTKDEVEKKWKNLKSASKANFSKMQRETCATGGGPPPTPLSPLSSAVVDVLGRDNPVLIGVEDGTDTTLNLLLELETYVSNDNSEDEQVHVAPIAEIQRDDSLKSLFTQKVKLEIEVLKLKKIYLTKKIKSMEE